MRFGTNGRARQHQCLDTVLQAQAQDHEQGINRRTGRNVRFVLRAILTFDLDAAIGA